MLSFLDPYVAELLGVLVVLSVWNLIALRRHNQRSQAACASNAEGISAVHGLVLDSAKNLGDDVGNIMGIVGPMSNSMVDLSESVNTMAKKMPSDRKRGKDGKFVKGES